MWIGIGVPAVVAGLVASILGWRIGGLATRPLAETVRAMDAVSRGEADFGFTPVRPTEFDRVVASYSRMRRALDSQQVRLRAAERAAAWREAARRVAHEVKNPLAPIRFSMENLLRARRQASDRFDEVFDESVRAVLDEVERLKGIVDAFGEFARLPEPRMAPGDLDGLVDSVLALHAGVPDVVWERRKEAAPINASMDRDLIARALRNVILNAVQALRDGGGTIRVTTRRDQGRAVVEVEDDGRGFEGESVARAGEPYFTTRENGTGLGLAITSRILAEHGGFLTWGNRPGGGAKVSLAIPVSQDGREDLEDGT